MTRYKKYIAILFTLLMVAAEQRAYALEVDREVMPRVTVGGRLIATPSVSWTDGFAGVADEEHNEIDISDSSLLLRFDKRLYDGGVAGASIAFTKPDADSDLADDIYFNQLHAFFWNKEYQVVLGRTRLVNTVIEFPTIRDDDLLSYTHVANLSSLPRMINTSSLLMSCHLAGTSIPPRHFLRGRARAQKPMRQATG